MLAGTVGAGAVAGVGAAKILAVAGVVGAGVLAAGAGVGVLAGAGAVAAGAIAARVMKTGERALQPKDFVPAGLATAGLAGASVVLNGGGVLLAGFLALGSAVSTCFAAKRILG